MEVPIDRFAHGGVMTFQCYFVPFPKKRVFGQVPIAKRYPTIVRGQSEDLQQHGTGASVCVNIE